MRRVGTLKYGRQLRVADASLHTRRADRARADADLDNVGPAQDQLFDHFTRDNVTGDDSVSGETTANLEHVLLSVLIFRQLNLSHIVDKVLRVAIGDVQADGGDVGNGVQNELDLLKVRVGRARAAGDVWQHVRVLLGKGFPLVQRVVLVNAHKAAVLGETLGYIERASRVHVSRHHRHALVGVPRVAELVLAFQLHLKDDV